MSGEIVRISSEWLDANKFRAYPFDESCANAAGRIPPSVFTDAFFITTGLSGGPLIIRRVVLGQTSFQLYMAAADVDLGLVADILYDTPDRTQIPIQASYGGGISLDGVLIVGNAQDIKTMQADNELDEENGKLFYGCCREFSKPGVTGIRVGNTIYDGVVDLVAGDGINITTTEGTGGVTTIQITAPSRVPPEANTEVINDSTLLDELIDLYGSPVTTINGVGPTESGNILLVHPSKVSSTNDGASTGSGDDEVSTGSGGGYTVFPVSGSVGAVVLGDATGAQEACEDTLVETIMSNISELNNRLSRISESIDAIDMANNVMSISLSRLT